MNNIIAFNNLTPYDVAIQIAVRVKARRPELNLIHWKHGRKSWT